MPDRQLDLFAGSPVPATHHVTPPGGPPFEGLTRARVRAVLTDAQFWVPVAILLGGLALLRWIQ